MKKSRIQKAEAWEQTREIGLWKYVLIKGGLWAIIVFFVSRLADLNKRSFSEIYFSRSAAISLLAFIAGGIVLYLLSWWFQERSYKKIKGRPEKAQNTLP